MDFRVQESQLKSSDCLSAMTLKMAVGSGLGTRLEEHLTLVALMANLPSCAAPNP